jgi:histidinol-phosphate aminotransferase
MKKNLLVRKNIRKMSGYIPGEQPGKKRYIKLNTNENPYPPSPKVLDAIKTQGLSDLRLYPDPDLTPLIKKASKIYNVPENCILAGNGSDELLAIVTRVFVGEGDKVVYPHPTYTLYETLVHIQGAETVHVPFPEDFSLPENISSVKGKILFLANPNSPSGTGTKASKIERVAKKFQGIVVVDEAYVDFAEDTSLGLVKKCDNVVVLRTFSKSFSLAGIRLGVSFAPPWITGEMKKVKDSYNVNRMSLAAGCAALGHISWMRRNVRKIIRTREGLTSHLRSLGFSVFPSGANFVLARVKGVSLKELYQELKKRKILVRYFDTEQLFDCVRITVGTDEEIDILLKNLEKLTGIFGR